MTDETMRAEFEAWAATANRVPIRHACYLLDAWDAWQAASAALRAERDALAHDNARLVATNAELATDLAARAKGAPDAC